MVFVKNRIDEELKPRGNLSIMPINTVKVIEKAFNKTVLS